MDQPTPVKSPTAPGASLAAAAADLSDVQPAFYHPFASGKYEVGPGLFKFGHDFGNGAADQRVFQLDGQFSRYRSAKLEARLQNLQDYVLSHNDSQQMAGGTEEFIARRLAHDYPTLFELNDRNDGCKTIRCELTDEVLCFDADWQLISEQTQYRAEPAYISALDALACQIQEDLALVCTSNGRNWVGALHICLPSHWIPREKIGRDFAEVHDIVPGMEQMNHDQEKFVNTMLNAKNGLVRFAWGIQIGEKLSRPYYAEDQVDASAQPVRLNLDRSNTYVRVERQTLWATGHGAALLTIRPYLIDLKSIRAEQGLAEPLANAIAEMSPESAQYKGVALIRRQLIDWIRGGKGDPQDLH